MNARRYLAVHLPRFPTDRLARRQPALRDGPFATWEARGPARLLVATCGQAAEAGLHPGLPLADATAMLPGLTAIPADPRGERASLDGLAVWAMRFTPLAASAPPDGLVLDVEGCGHLWGGEAGLRGEVLGRLERAGFEAWAATASTAQAALVLARAGGGGDLASGGEAEALAPLPTGLLRLGEKVEEALARLGLRRIGEVARQPRGPLARRIGAAALARLDEALGRLHRPIVPIRPLPAAQVAEDFAEPLISEAPIAGALRRLVERLTQELGAQGQGARRLELGCFRVDGTVQRLGLGTARAARDSGHLLRLFEEQRGRIEPRFGIERMVLAATVIEALGAEQEALPKGGPGGEVRREELARLVDRLSQRLRVRRMAPVLSHWPERAVRSAPALAPVPVPSGWGARVRPVRLVDPPEPLRVEGERLVWRGAVVALREGPERLEPEWWRGGAEVARDYWRAETEAGARLWVFRSGAGWYLHGHLI